MPETRTDQELIDAAAAGEKAAFDALFQRHRDWVYSMACRFVDRETAADVVQEVFIYLLRKIDGERAEAAGGLRLTAKMTTFLYPAVRNSALAIKRKRRRYVGPDEGILELLPAGINAPGRPARTELQTGGSGPDALLDGTESLAKLLEAVRRLPVGQQEVLLMRVVDEMSVAEVAAALEIPEGTVKSRLFLALGALRAEETLRTLLAEI